MKTINLFESNELVELKKFAGGECHVKFLTEINEGDNKYYIIAGGLLVGINRWEKEDRIFNYDLDLEHDEVIAKS